LSRLEGKRVLISGASSGIGLACARFFATRQCHLYLCARRLERLDPLKTELSLATAGEVEIHRLDVRSRVDVEQYVADLHARGKTPDILINSAGLSRGLEPFHQGHIEDWEEMIDTNVKGLLYLSRAVLPLMIERNSGHVIHIGSVAGDIVYPGGNVYAATKFAVKALNEAMNLDAVGTKVRISSVDPGMVETEFSEVRFHGDEDRARRVYQGLRPLSAADVAEVVGFVAEAPEHVNVMRTLLYPTDQRSPYVLHREAPPAP
jgi:3-hydroxy acid dehydrogenase / malonic semialdehyde reductase